MSKKAKKGARGAGAGLPPAMEKAPTSGFDLRTITLADIDTLGIGSSEMVVRVQLARHFGIGAIEYTEDLPIDNDTTQPDLVRIREAVRDLFLLVQTAVRNRAVESGEMPCATCTGACCRSWDVLLTPEDHDRLLAHDLGKLADLFQTSDIAGNVGRMEKVHWKNPKTKETELACAGLGKDGLCAIYEARPTICREFSAWNCDDKEEWLDAPMKRRLKVLG
jgi:Fe-S-cluster containining protein